MFKVHEYFYKTPYIIAPLSHTRYLFTLRFLAPSGSTFLLLSSGPAVDPEGGHRMVSHLKKKQKKNRC